MVLSRIVKMVEEKLEKMPPDAPRNNLQAVITIAEAMRYAYSQRLSKRDLLYLPNTIIHAVTDKDKKTIASECHERSDCVQLKDPGVIKELHEIEKLLMLQSGKRDEANLLPYGFAKDDVLRKNKSARIQKPSFRVIRDKKSKCVFVFIRGTHGIKDILTYATAAPIPFDHKFICNDDKVRKRNNMNTNTNTVSGHAHRGMVTAARWIRKHCTTLLLDVLRDYPDFKIKIVGHSLGGGAAALLTFMLREMEQFSSCTCVTFGPAACMTLELAEFGKSFITSIINDSDIVPSLSVSSVHHFIHKGRNKDKNIVTAVGSHLTFAKTITKHAVTHCTQVVKNHKQRTHSSQSSETSCETLLTEEVIIESVSDDDDECNFSIERCDEADSEDEDEDEDELSNIHAKEKEERESGSPVPKPFYPPGKIMHMVTENINSNHKFPDEKHVSLYETPTQFYGKLRFSRRIIVDHLSKNYLNKLRQLIDQLERESCSNMVDMK